MRKNLGIVVCLALPLVVLAGCDREEQAHEIHLTKGIYAGKPTPKLDERQVSQLERRATRQRY